jgi:hypothetical protein
MNLKSRIPVIILALMMGVFLVAVPAQAAPVAKISSFSGDVVVLTGTKVVKVSMVGQAINSGDRIQTQQGEAVITFFDGAILKVNPFGSALVQDREEESGFWPFKTRKIVRRLTCLVGKLWFKSGSRKENYLQTPTAVAGLRGSEANFGYDNVNNLLDVIYGETFGTLGSFTSGPFDNPGQGAANQSTVYQALLAAGVAAAAGADNPEAAELAALEAIAAAAEALAQNPDPAVAAEAQAVAQTTQAKITEKTGVTTAAPTTRANPTTTVNTTTTTSTTTSTSSTTAASTT